MNEKLNDLLEQELSISRMDFIIALKTKNIQLNFGSGEYPISIYYPHNHIYLYDNLLSICKTISSEEWKGYSVPI